MIPKNPACAFNPLRSYKKQFAETLKSHGKYEAGSFVEQCLDTLGALGLTDAERILKSCPCQLSGGMNQRMAIALCLMMEYELLLCDEPTSALDPISTGKIEELAQELKRDYTIVIVTHNMQQAARISDSTAFFLLGKLVEMGDTAKIFNEAEDSRMRDYVQGKFG